MLACTAVFSENYGKQSSLPNIEVVRWIFGHVWRPGKLQLWKTLSAWIRRVTVQVEKCFYSAKSYRKWRLLWKFGGVTAHIYQVHLYVLVELLRDGKAHLEGISRLVCWALLDCIESRAQQFTGWPKPHKENKMTKYYPSRWHPQHGERSSEKWLQVKKTILWHWKCFL